MRDIRIGEPTQASRHRRHGAQQAGHFGVAALGRKVASGLVVVRGEARVRAFGQQQLYDSGGIASELAASISGEYPRILRTFTSAP